MNFRRYILEIIAQSKKDKKDTLKDCKERKQKSDYQKGYFDGRLGILNKLYNDCKTYEWVKRK